MLASLEILLGIARVSKSFNGTGTASARHLHGVGTSANSQSDCYWQRASVRATACVAPCARLQ